MSAVGDDDRGPDCGSVYVFEGTGESWTEETKLTAPVAAGAQLGVALALSGSTLVVGAPFENDLTGEFGAAFVFARHGEAWSYEARLVAPDAAAEALFGGAVAIDGDTALVGARLGNGYRGAAYVFVRSGTTWTHQAELVSPDGVVYSYFGSSVAVDGDTALVGEPRASVDGLVAGGAYLFERTGTAWAESAFLRASDASEAAQFGTSAALDDGTALVGTQEGDVRGGEIGSAYVFTSATCGNGIVEHGEACDGEPCCTDACALAGATTTCRASTSACDAEELCTGASAACPDDAPPDPLCCLDADACDDGDPCTRNTCEANACVVETLCHDGSVSAPDAGNHDAGNHDAGPHDAGPHDASTAPDASAALDGGPLDSGPIDGGAAGGCGCAVPTSTTPPSGLALALLAALGLVVRRRVVRRRRAGR